MRRAGYAALTICACCAAAFAAAPAGAVTPSASDTLQIEIAATVVDRCGLSAGANPTSAQGNLEQAETLSFNFDLDCNTPFAVGVSSEHGGLRLTTATGSALTDDTGFGVQKAYKVALSVNTDSGTLDGGNCMSDQLTSSAGNCAFYGTTPGSGLSSGQKTAVGQAGTLTVSWNSDEGAARRHAAGLYKDTLTIVVGPKT